MAFIKVQRLVRGDAGEIVGGSAAIVETHYVRGGKFHARHSVRERLGKVLEIAENRKSGVFLSPTRGVVAYDSESDTFTEVERGDRRVSALAVFPDAPVHAVFGDVHLFLSFLEKYCFKRAGNLYFGDRHRVTIDGNDEFAYVYVDLFNANKRLCDCMGEHEAEFNGMKDCEKDWYKVKFGFFVLLSNKDRTPEELLSEYFGRVAIEGVFKTGKEYLQLLPLAKWTDLTVRGKILHDVIDTTALLMLRKELASSTISTSELFGAAQSLMCFKSGKDAVTVEQPNRKVKAYYKLLGMEVPSHLSLGAFSSHILEGAEM